MIISLSIILQIGLFLLIGYIANRDFYLINLIFSILGILLVLFIFLKDEPANFKLPWIMLILIAPFLGIILYVMLGNKILPRKTLNKIKAIENDALELSKKVFDKDFLQNEDKLAFGQANYLSETSKLPVYKNKECNYYSTGESFFEMLISELKKAKKYIFMEYFIIEEGKMFNQILDILEMKVKEDVKIYFMYDDVGSIGKVSWKYFKALRDKGINAVKFNPFNPIISSAHNNRDHRKITVIDGEIGFVSGMNLADEYVNYVKRFGYWKDNGIIFKGNAVNNLILTFIQLYNVSGYINLNPNDFLVEISNDEEYDGFIHPFLDGPAPVDNAYIGKNAFLNIINQAKNYVYISTPYLIVDFHFLEALKSAKSRGVDVRIITPHIADKKIVNVLTKNSYYTLTSNGVKVYEYEPGFIHSKMIIADDEFAIVGTINLDHRSFAHHYENAVWMYKTSCIFDIKNDFEKMFENDVIEIENNASKLKWYQRIIRNILIIFSVLF